MIILISAQLTYDSLAVVSITIQNFIKKVSQELLNWLLNWSLSVYWLLRELFSVLWEAKITHFGIYHRHDNDSMIKQQ